MSIPPIQSKSTERWGKSAEISSPQLFAFHSFPQLLYQQLLASLRPEARFASEEGGFSLLFLLPAQVFFGICLQFQPKLTILSWSCLSLQPVDEVALASRFDRSSEVLYLEVVGCDLFVNSKPVGLEIFTSFIPIFQSERFS